MQESELKQRIAELIWDGAMMLQREGNISCNQIADRILDLFQSKLGIAGTEPDLEASIERRLADLLEAEQWFQMYSGLVRDGQISGGADR